MTTKREAPLRASLARTDVKAAMRKTVLLSKPAVKARRSRRQCKDCKAETAFHAWHDIQLPASLNVFVDFSDWGIPQTGTRVVIELVTAQVVVPHGDTVRLRMYTSLGSVPSNIDLVVTPQGGFTNLVDPTHLLDVFVATHAIRAYSDALIEFDINRSTDQGGGSALICISGYLAKV